jgi:hypothetical protein
MEFTFGLSETYASVQCNTEDGLVTCLYNCDCKQKLIFRLTCAMKFPTTEMYL